MAVSVFGRVARFWYARSRVGLTCAKLVVGRHDVLCRFRSGSRYARAFTPVLGLQPVVDPAFMPGKMKPRARSVLFHTVVNLSGPFTGLIFTPIRGSGSPINGADNENRQINSRQPFTRHKCRAEYRLKPKTGVNARAACRFREQKCDEPTVRFRPNNPTFVQARVGRVKRVQPSPAFLTKGGTTIAAGIALVVLLMVTSGCRPAGDSGSGQKPGSDQADQASELEPMVRIAGGSFTMGSEHGGDDERPPHHVTLDAFYIDKHPVTQESYQRLMGKNPSKNKEDAKNPVERVRWSDALVYCNARSKRDGLDPCYRQGRPGVWECNFEASGYRLPTEAEWEYACRAGTDADYFFGNSTQELRKYAWFAANAGNKTHAVGQKPPNAWGLHDMHGNVWEWVNDFYAPDYYKGSPERNPRGPKSGMGLMRGGSFRDSPDSCRCSYRKYNDDEDQTLVCAAYEHLGFRCARACKDK